MAELGFEQVKVDEFLNPSRTPTPEEAAKFGIGADQTVFEIYHVAYDGSGRAVEVCHHVGPIHMWEFVYRVSMK